MAIDDETNQGTNAVSQAGAIAGRDIAGRDVVKNYYPVPCEKSTLSKLKLRLQHEVETGRHCLETLEELQRFKKPIADDGVSGLEAKLEFSGRAGQIIPAFEMKEEFAKLLDRWSLYASAQEIFAHLLAMADYKYRVQILPQLGNLTDVEYDELVEDKIVRAVIEGVGIDVFSMNHHSAMGMVYWLAEQCRVRWHQ